MKNEILQGEASPPLAEGRYRLLSVLGVGGMATVYRGYDARLQVYRAVKVLSPALARRKSLKTRFEAEAKTMALLQHRNIVSVHDVGADGNRLFIVMEMVEGGSLLDRVREYGPLPPRMGLDVTIKMLDALRVAHRRGVVHRDIKPHNILLTPEGDIRITDFGIAQMRKSEEDDDGLTKTGAVMGTWGFMAPEQRQDAKTVDFRADIYSVGATLYSVLTDKTPVDLFAADMDASMMADLPSPLAEVIKTATRYNRDERYPDSMAMAEACRRVMDLLDPDPPGTPPLALPARHDNLEVPEGAHAGGAWGSSGASGGAGVSAGGASAPPAIPHTGVAELVPPMASLPPPPVRSTTTNGGTLIPSAVRPIPAWRAPREPGTGETAVPEDGTDISDYLEPSESDEVARPGPPATPNLAIAAGLAGLAPDPTLPDRSGAFPALPLPLPAPLPNPGTPQVVVAPAEPDRRVMTLVMFTSVTAVFTLIAVLALVVVRPWEAERAAQAPVNTPPVVQPTQPPPTPPGPEVQARPPDAGTPAVQPPVEATSPGPSPTAGSSGSTRPGPDRPRPEGSAPSGTGGTGSGTAVASGSPTGTPPSGPDTPAAAAELKHSPPSHATLGQTLTLKAVLPSEAWDVTLRYRAAGSSSWSNVRMVGSGGSFTGGFTVDESYVGGVEYFISARPLAGGDALSSGSGFKPLKLPARR